MFLFVLIAVGILCKEKSW